MTEPAPPDRSGTGLLALGAAGLLLAVAPLAMRTLDLLTTAPPPGVVPTLEPLIMPLGLAGVGVVGVAVLGAVLTAAQKVASATHAAAASVPAPAAPPDTSADLKRVVAELQRAEARRVEAQKAADAEARAFHKSLLQAAVLPLVSFQVKRSDRLFTLTLRNDGAGPARITSLVYQQGDQTFPSLQPMIAWEHVDPSVAYSIRNAPAVLAPRDALVLAELRVDDEPLVDTSPIHNVLAQLRGVVLTLTYTDVYQTPMEPVTQMLKGPPTA